MISETMIIILKEVFEDVNEFLDGPIFAVETGCSFAWTKENLDNLSSLNIVKYLTLPGGTLLSIDNNETHIKICQQELFKRNLFKRVAFVYGDSVDALESISNVAGYDEERLKIFNFFWLDSMEDEEHGLQEYDYAINSLKKPGVLCIDDYNSSGSVKWRKSSKLLKKDADYFKEYNTKTGLIVGFFNN